MLIVTRRPGEKVMIGDEIVVEVLEVSGQSVRIGIAAPRAIPVYREEIWDAVKQDAADAADAANGTSPTQAHPQAQAPT